MVSDEILDSLRDAFWVVFLMAILASAGCAWTTSEERAVEACDRMAQRIRPAGYEARGLVICDHARPIDHCVCHPYLYHPWRPQ